MRTNSDVSMIRWWLITFMMVLAISGLTAVPLVWLTGLFANITSTWSGPWHDRASSAEAAMIHVDHTYPFLFYGTDWLAFAHVVIALAFLGPYRDPVRNRWVIEWALISCALVVVVAFAWAPVRGIPFFWRCVDASFGVVGAIPLWLVLRRIDRLEAMPHSHR